MQKAASNIVLHNRTSVFSTPHRFLKQRRVAFTLPTGWHAEDISSESPSDFPHNWWIENWDKTGLYWKIFQAKQGTNAPALSFDLSIDIEYHGRNRMLYTSKRLVTRDGYHGFYGRPGYSDGPNSLCFVIQIPQILNDHYDVLCEFNYNKNNYKAIEPQILRTMESMKFRQ